MSVLFPLRDFAVFFGYVFLAGAALGSTRVPAGPLRLLLGIATALAAEFAVGFTGFVVGLSNGITAAVTAIAVAIMMVARWRRVVECSRDPAVRHLVVGWVVFAAWGIGLLASVKTYSGGGWCVDWVEHWQRTQFFLHREPLDTRFALQYSLTARPPLANLLIALWLEATDRSFASFQIFMTLLGCLVALPAVLLSRHFAHDGSAGHQASDLNHHIDASPAERYTWLLLMLSPVVAQNLTFSWTKLPTAFFVLTGLVFALFGLEAEDERPAPSTAHVSAVNLNVYGCAAAGCLGLGVLTHYSAAPWAIAIAASVLAAALGVGAERKRILNKSILFGFVFGVVLAPWVVWAGAKYGLSTLASSTSTGGAWHAESMSDRVLVPLKNIFDTVVPFPLRGEPGDGLITQASVLGRLRDVAFNVYQLNLPLAFGLSGLWVLVWTSLKRPTRNSTGRTIADGIASVHQPSAALRRFWWVLIPLIVVLGIVVHTPRDEWGLTHICLQPLVVLGLAFVGAVLGGAPTHVRRLWAALATIDATLGLILHFGLESWALRPLVTASGDPWAYVRQLNHTAWVNANDKWGLKLAFVSDRWPVPTGMIALWLALCFAYVIIRVIHARPARRF